MAEPQLRNFVAFGRKIVAVGRNYRAHALELGNPIPTKPLLFLKPTSSYIQEGTKIRMPEGSSNLQPEVELAIVIGRRLSRHVTESEARSAIGGLALALDMTARDVQDEAKKAGHPWLMAKGFDTACPVSQFIEREAPSDEVLTGLDVWCTVNGVHRQRGSTSDMIFSVPFLLAYIARYVTLERGDVVLTGTPEGVARVVSGDVIECGLERKGGGAGKELVRMKFEVE